MVIKQVLEQLIQAYQNYFYKGNIGNILINAHTDKKAYFNQEDIETKSSISLIQRPPILRS